MKRPPAATTMLRLQRQLLDTMEFGPVALGIREPSDEEIEIRKLDGRRRELNRRKRQRQKQQRQRAWKRHRREGKCK